MKKFLASILFFAAMFAPAVQAQNTPVQPTSLANLQPMLIYCYNSGTTLWTPTPPQKFGSSYTIVAPYLWNGSTFVPASTTSGICGNGTTTNITLVTSATSGAASIVGTVLHIPNYTSGGVTATGSACTITTITNGVITAATCTP